MDSAKMGSLEAGQVSSQPAIVRGRGKNKKFWNFREETVLIETLAELNGTSWKTDSGYKNGYCFYIEKRMEEKLPGCGLKADPHIESKIKIFKRHHSYILDIEENGKGFRWDDEQKMVVGNKDAFLSWAKNHEGASALFMKPFIHFDKLCEIYGKNKKKRKRGRALPEPTNCNHPVGHGGNSGSETQSNSNAKEDSTCITQSTLAPLPPPPPPPSLEAENKNPDKSPEFDSSETELLGTIRSLVEAQRDLAMAMINMNKASSYNVEITELRKKLFGVLMNLPGLSPMDVVKVARIIGQDDRKLEVFFTMPDEYKVMFAHIELASS